MGGSVGSLCMFWLSEGKFRGALVGLLHGVAGIAVAVLFGFYIFYFIVGKDSYGIGPFLASIIPLGLTVIGSFKISRERINMHRDMSSDLKSSTLIEMMVSTSKFSSIGLLVGIAFAIAWFLITYGAA